MSDFAERIKELRKKRGMSQAALGKILALRQDAISTYERGKNYPEVRNLIVLADFFGVSTDYLLGRTDDPEVHQLAPREFSRGETVGSSDNILK